MLETTAGAAMIFVVCAGTVTLCATFLAKLAEGLSQATGLSRVWIGATALAGITSLPELVGGFRTGELQLADLAVGGLVGSNLCNLALLAGCLFYALKLRPTVASVKLVLPSAILSLAMVTLLAVGLIVKQPVLLGAGLASWLLVALYMGATYAQFRSEQSLDGADARPPLRSRLAEFVPQLLLMVGLGVILAFAMVLLVSSAEILAKQTGLGETFIGTLLLALVTSLPELVSSLAAVKMGALDLAIGNFFGSNSLNMVVVWVADLPFKGNLLSSASKFHLISAAGVVLATGMLLWARAQLAGTHPYRGKLAATAAGAALAVYAGVLYLLYSFA